MVQTVRGTVSPSDLGRTLMHEHVVYGPPGWYADRTIADFDEDRYVERAVDRIEAVHERHDVGTIVDATANDTGRKLQVLRAVAKETDVNLVCSTGLYPESPGAATYFQHRDLVSDGTEEITELFTTEVSDGIQGTDVRAGVVKVGTSYDEVTDYERMVLTAAARTQRETGVPIITHTTAGTMATEQAEHLVSSGATPGKVVVGHVGPHDLDDLREALERGVYVAFDQFGIHSEVSDEKRTEKLLQLVEEGYEDRIVVSNDFIINWLSRSVDPLGEEFPDWSLEGVFRQLHEADVDLHQLLVANPRELFENEYDH